MHPYRTHTCGALRDTDAGTIVRLSGWINRKRDHGQLLFIDLRDHYGLTQVVIDSSSPLFKVAEGLRLESVITVSGKVVLRTPETINDKLPTGRIEIQLEELTVQSAADQLRFRSTVKPMPARKSACATASWTLGARRCSRT